MRVLIEDKFSIIKFEKKMSSKLQKNGYLEKAIDNLNIINIKIKTFSSNMLNLFE